MKHIIFDFDGTLVDTLELSRELFNQVAAQYHLPSISKSDIPSLRDKSVRQLIKEWKVSPLQLAKLTGYIHAEMKKHISNVPSIKNIDKMLGTMKQAGWELGVVTSNSTENVNAFLEKNNWSYFDFVYSKKSLFGKHMVLKKLIKEKELPLENTWYVGDEVRDIEAARKAGMKIISVSWGFNSETALQQAQPDFLANTPQELWEYLSKLRTE